MICINFVGITLGFERMLFLVVPVNEIEGLLVNGSAVISAPDPNIHILELVFWSSFFIKINEN